MKKANRPGILTVVLLPFLLSSANVNALGHIQKIVTGCPKNNTTIIPAGGRFSIDDVVISTNKNQKVTLKFTPGPVNLMQVFVKGYESVVTNFQGQVESQKEQALKLDCAGMANTTVTLTVTGSGNI